jgi:adenylosuccinate lyase
MSKELFRAIFVPDRFRVPVSGRAWLQAMLDAEGALAVAETRVGLILREVAEAPVYRCEADRSDPEKMRENLYQTKGMLMAENVTTVVANRLGRLEAHELVGAAPQGAADDGKPFREELLAEPVLCKQLSTEEIDAALDQARYLGSAGAFVDQALELYRGEAPS